MPLPKSLRIIGFDFSVALEDSEDFSHMGEVNRYTQSIRIKSDVEGGERQDTLLHETLHAISDAMGADLSEMQVAVISRGILAVLRDNPKLVTYLTEKE